MNFIFISPHNPTNYWLFCDRLTKNGVTVLGIGDCPYEDLDNQVKRALLEYYYVDSMDDYDQMFRAVAFFSFKYGKIDWIESNNEKYLELDARLRTDFNVTTGFTPSEVKQIRHKSAMKPFYLRAHIPSARFAHIPSLKEAKQFTRQYGYPVIIKPDVGTGAKDTFRIDDAKDLEWFFWEKSSTDYIIEEFVYGNIYSYDAIINSKGEPLFESMAAWPPSILDIVANQSDLSYYVAATIPNDLRAAGRALVRVFNIRSRFIHLEFFRLTEDQGFLGKEGSLVGMEVNMRPAGGYTIDMMNYAHSTDIYQIWADMITKDSRIMLQRADDNFCVFAGRRKHHEYVHPHAEILEKYKTELVMNQELPVPWQPQMGNYMYSARLKTQDDVTEFIRFVQEQYEDNGRKKQVYLKELEAGMILAQPIVLQDGKVLMEAGTRMTEFVIRLLQDPNYMEKAMPNSGSLDKMMLTVEIPEHPVTLSVEDLSHINNNQPAEADEEKAPPPNPKQDQLLDSDYVETYNEVFAELEKLLNPNTIHKGIDLGALRNLIAGGKLDKLCDGFKAVSQIHNMDREGSYLLHHSLHVGILAGLMGPWLRWPKEHRERLLLAGLLHDVGKLKISEEILNKPGKLSNSEMNIVRRHSALGAEILAKCGISPEGDIIVGILQHHERCDGSGYPSGLKRNMISPFGQILAILDIYDAMAANRAYAHKVSPFDIFDRLITDIKADRIDEGYCMLFVRQLCQALTGSWVRLTSHEKAKIIYIDPNHTPPLPIVQTTKGKFYDFSTTDAVKIEELLTMKEATEG
ncbi:MAG: HD domain-containing protein [Schwartzia sp.]|nr:HD domain-containing protein [Schwartzia sp. (in: firmicutes)]